MIIHNGFYLDGFKRMDKGEEGAVFVRYEEYKPTQEEPTIEKKRNYYYTSNDDVEEYIVRVPKIKAPKLISCAIVTRSSKNCYSATCFDEFRIETFKADSLDGLRNAVADFFEGA